MSMKFKIVLKYVLKNIRVITLKLLSDLSNYYDIEKQHRRRTAKLKSNEPFYFYLER